MAICVFQEETSQRLLVYGWFAQVRNVVSISETYRNEANCSRKNADLLGYFES